MAACAELLRPLYDLMVAAEARHYNNVAEREMKRIAIGRKNWLFVGSALYSLSVVKTRPSVALQVLVPSPISTKPCPVCLGKNLLYALLLFPHSQNGRAIFGIDYLKVLDAIQSCTPGDLPLEGARKKWTRITAVQSGKEIRCSGFVQVQPGDKFCRTVLTHSAEVFDFSYLRARFRRENDVGAHRQRSLLTAYYPGGGPNRKLG
jgi:transposase IS66 family protein